MTQHNTHNFKKQTEEWLMRIIESFLVEADDINEHCKEELLTVRSRLESKKQALSVLQDVVSGKKFFKGYKESAKPHIEELLANANKKHTVRRRIRKDR